MHDFENAKLVISMNVGDEYAIGLKQKFIDLAFISSKVIQKLTVRAFCTVHKDTFAFYQNINS